MPERVGPFQRVEVTQYDEAGLNLSAGYNRLPGEGDPWPIAATVYVYPVRPGVELDAAFEKLLGDSYVVLYQWKSSWVKWRVTTPAPVSPERTRATVELTETLVPQPNEAGTPSHPSSETETPNSPELFASGTASRCLAVS